ncbi:MAG: hypothetical protein AAFN79_21995, partial [Pseudomonadota bacterium]
IVIGIHLSDLSEFPGPLQEPLYVFLAALVLWVTSELTDWPFQNAEKVDEKATANDVRIAREFISLHSRKLRFLLKENDPWSFVESDRYSELSRLLNRHECDEVFFHDEDLNTKLDDLMKKLDDFSWKIALDTVPEKIAGAWRTGYKPYEIVSEEEYQRRRTESKEAGRLAGVAWEALDLLIADLRNRIPEAWDQPLESAPDAAGDGS